MAKPSKQVRKVDDRHIRLEYLGGRCAVCRRSVAAVERRFLTSKQTFEFNHIDPDCKSPVYDKLISRVLSAQQLDELDKCNLLCRICHGAWTNQRLRGTGKWTIELPDGRVLDREVSFHGMITIQRGKPKFLFFFDENPHLDSYEFKLGEGDPMFRVGFELRRELNGLILATRQGGMLRIWDGKGLVFSAERLDEASLRFQYETRFPFFKAEFRTHDPDHPYVWIRHGKTITKGRGVRKGGTISGVMEYIGCEKLMGSAG